MQNLTQEQIETEIKLGIEMKIKEEKINKLQYRLNKLSQDLIQAQAGAIFDDIEERKLEFQKLHNELRTLLGKEPRIYKKEEIING